MHNFSYILKYIYIYILILTHLAQFFASIIKKYVSHLQNTTSLIIEYLYSHDCVGWCMSHLEDHSISSPAKLSQLNQLLRFNSDVSAFNCDAGVGVQSSRHLPGMGHKFNTPLQCSFRLKNIHWFLTHRIIYYQQRKIKWS